VIYFPLIHVQNCIFLAAKSNDEVLMEFDLKDPIQKRGGRWVRVMVDSEREANRGELYHWRQW
jgi:hypothetical protein